LYKLIEATKDENAEGENEVPPPEIQSVFTPKADARRFLLAASRGSGSIASVVV
jgi:hypothetical protein